MTMINPGWSKVVLFDLQTGDLVQYNTLLPELTGLEVTAVKTETANSSYMSSRQPIPKFATPEYYAVKELLQPWVDQRRRICAIAVGQCNMMWLKPSRIAELIPNFKANRRESDNAVVIALEEMTAAGDHVDEQVNLIRRAFVNGQFIERWDDTNANQSPDGYAVTGGSNSEFNRSAAYFKSTITGPFEMRLLDPIIFPVEGVRLNFAVDVLAHPGAFTLQIQAIDFAGNVIATSTTADSATLGRESVEMITPAGIWAIQVKFITDDIFVDDTLTLRYPSLRTDGIPTYPDEQIQLAQPNEMVGVNWNQDLPSTALTVL